MNYLKSVGKSTPEFEKEVQDNIMHGFQNIKQIMDSEKVEGNENRIDSVWFAALTTKLLNMAKDIVTPKESRIMEKTIDDILNATAALQKPNGSFEDNTEDFVYFGKKTEKSKGEYSNYQI